MNDIFRPGLDVPDIGLGLLLHDIAEQRRRAAGDDAVSAFIGRLSAAMRRGADGEASGEADAGDLDAAERREVGAVLEAGVAQARAEGRGVWLELNLLRWRWHTFARA